MITYKFLITMIDGLQVTTDRWDIHTCTNYRYAFLFQFSLGSLQGLLLETKILSCTSWWHSFFKNHSSEP